MNRPALALVACITTAACRADSESIVLVKVTADEHIAPVVQIRGTFSNQGTGQERLFPMNGSTTPIMFPTAFSVTLPRAKAGALDIALDGLGAGGAIVANGTTRVVIAKGARIDIEIRLRPGASLCGNSRPDVGEECDDGNRVSGDGCSYVCGKEADAGVTPPRIDGGSDASMTDAPPRDAPADGAPSLDGPPSGDVSPSPDGPAPTDTMDPLRPNGAVCTQPGQCQSGVCAGGLCCDRACAGGCVSCATGTCTSVCQQGQSCFADMCGGSEVVDIAGSSFACALTKAGRLFCWGVNQYGQLGVPISGNQRCGPDQWPCRFEAVEVRGLTDAVDVSVGLDFACAVRKTGAVVCWGRNEFGQLGHSPATDPSCGEPCNDTPTEVKGLAGAVGVAAGRWHACAWTASGTAFCWGRNNEGVLGRGVLSEMDPAAAPVVGLGQGGLRKIAMMLGGVNHACAVKDDRTVWCWGRNSHGQLGRTPGAAPDVACLGDFCGATAAQVPGMTGVIDVFVSDGASCVVRDDESVWCWGFDGSGLRGAFTGSAAAARVAGIPPALSGSAHRGHVCVRSTLSDVWCWGQNYFGMLGDGTFSGGFGGHACQCKPPAQVPNTKVKLLSVANDFTLGVKFEGTVWAWGFSSAGALGHQPGTEGDIACSDQKPCNPTPRQSRGLPP